MKQSDDHPKPLARTWSVQIVFLFRNFNFFIGLINGTTGYVEDIIWAPGAWTSDIPQAVLVSCKDYMGPTR
jgi:hypothetical protein